MQIYVNEKPTEVPGGTTAQQLRDRLEPHADIMIVNGHAISADLPLQPDDKLILITRGKIPSADELEALMVARHTPGVHAKVKAATVGIAGLGGLGSAIAIALARLGVGRLILADFDIVEPSNLNRQQYFLDQLGLPKTQATAANISRINPYVNVTLHQARVTPENIDQIFAAVNVMCEAFDAADQKAMLCETFTARFPDIPLVMATGLAGCSSANTIITRQLAPNLYVVGDLETAAQPGMGLMAPRVGVAAHHQANAILQLLLGETCG